MDQYCECLIKVLKGDSRILQVKCDFKNEQVPTKMVLITYSIDACRIFGNYSLGNHDKKIMIKKYTYHDKKVYVITRTTL